MNKLPARILGAAAMLLAGYAATASAQCSTCAAPAAVPVTVGYAPTVSYQPYTGWYPGRMLDRMRLRRWSRRAEPAYTAAYAPTYSAAYAPASSASYAPAYSAGYAPTSYSAAYTPYTASYAYTASYSPYVTAYAPLQRRRSYYQPAILRPVVAMSPVVAEMGVPCGGCGGCDACSGCSSCSSCDGGVAQAGYLAPASGCSSCSAGGGVPDYSYGDSGAASGYGAPNYGAETPRPALTRPPTNLQYDTQRVPTEAAPPAAEAPPAGADPGPAEDADTDASMYPRLLQPVRDRTARAPTVDVWNAVYKRPVPTRTTSLRSETAPAPRQRTQAEIDADPWTGAGN